MVLGKSELKKVEMKFLMKLIMDLIILKEKNLTLINQLMK